MSTSDREAFLAGERTEDVLISLPDHSVSDAESLAEHGERVDDGTVLVLPGEQGRAAFQQATGVDPMTFAQRAMQTEGDIDHDCTGATCPKAHPEENPDEHRPRFVFAFAEARNEEVGGLYAEGPVIHAYVHCECDAAFSDRWVASED